MMNIDIFEVGPFAENTYLLTKSDQSILIDPGFFDPREYIAFKNKLQERKSGLTAICLTHAHVDHVLGLDRVLKDNDIPVYLNHTDLYLWKNFPEQANMFGFRTAGFDFIPEPLPEQKGVQLGIFTFDVIYTPGHSPDHVSFYFEKENVLIAGDVLFRESIGRTDLYNGDFNLISETIRSKLYTLPEDTSVYPGHGPQTTIGHEKKHNSFVKA